MKLFRSGKPVPEPDKTPGPNAEPAWHKAYGQTTDASGKTVRNWQNWRRCECNLDADHDG
jgi:hypothetical protein